VSELAIDLGISQVAQNAWIAGDVIQPGPAMTGVALIVVHDPDALSRLLHAAFQYGAILNPMGANVRQQICLGLAFVEVVQLLNDPLTLSMGRVAAAVGHWIRIYDPTASVFMRRKQPFTVFMWRNGLRLHQLDPYLPRVLLMMKNGLVSGAETSMDGRIRAAQTPQALYEAIRGEAAVKTGSTTLFLRVGKHQNLDFGLSLPSIGASFDQRYTEVDMIWEHLMMMHGAEVAQEASAGFLHSAIKWVHEWMKLTPVMDGSHYIGSIIFHALLCSYFSIDLTDVRLTPVALHLEALLNADFEQFRGLVVQSYPVAFVESNAIRELPNVLELLATYPQRYLALWQVNDSADFLPYFTRYMRAGFDEPATVEDHEIVATEAEAEEPVDLPT
jgi:hypothetical protein